MITLFTSFIAPAIVAIGIFEEVVVPVSTAAYDKGVEIYQDYTKQE